MEKPRKGSKGGGIPVYDESFKIAVAREYLTGKLSYLQLAKKYGLPKSFTIAYFVKWYKKWEQGQEAVVHQQPELTQQAPNEELQRQLHEANLKITALEMMIRTAEDTLQIDIRKKPGTK